MKSLITIASVLLLGSLASGLAIPERLKHGSFYKTLMKEEAAHHQTLGNFTPNTTASYVTMPLNHQDASWGTFQDRFFFDTTFWDQENNGPCMFYLNGEGPLTSAIGGYMAELAKDFKACTVAIEHRWYGKSYPADQADNKTLFTNTLNVHSAMEDVIFLMNHFQTKVFNKPQMTWFLVGGSYSGGMTVWMNEKYPTTFKASWAASGVVRATFAYTEFDGHVKSVTPQVCHDTLTRITHISERLYNTAGGKLRLQELFQTGPVSQPGLMSTIIDAAFSSVQYSSRTNMCAALGSLPMTSADDWAILEAYNATMAGFFGPDFFAMSACRYEPDNCAYGKKMVHDHLLEHHAGSPLLSRLLEKHIQGDAVHYPNAYSWEWQICSEMAWWITGYPGSVMSSNVSVTYYMDQCHRFFYQDTYPDTWKFNAKHHALFPVTPAPIIATQGSDDPWSTTGLTKSPRPNIAFNKAYCVDCGHCSSMMSPTSYDAAVRPQLVAQRKMVKDFLAKHLNITL